MSLLFFDGFDHYALADISYKWNEPSPGNFGIGAVGQNGTNGLQFTTHTTTTKDIKTAFWAATNTLYIGFAIYIFDFAALRYGAFLPCLISGTSTEENKVAFQDGTTKMLVTTGSGTRYGTFQYQLNTWYYVEMAFYLHDTSGTIKIWVDGNLDIDFSGDSKITNGNITALKFGGGPNSVSWNMDNLYVCDNQGTIANSNLGQVRIESIFPTANGNYTQWTPTAGSNYQCVDETLANDDTDYVYTTLSGNRDSYLFGSLTTVSGEVFGIGTYLWNRKNGIGYRRARPFLRINSTDHDSSLKYLSNSYSYFKNYYETNPETTSGWTISEINSLEMGMKSEE